MALLAYQGRKIGGTPGGLSPWRGGLLYPGGWVHAGGFAVTGVAKSGVIRVPKLRLVGAGGVGPGAARKISVPKVLGDVGRVMPGLSAGASAGSSGGESVRWSGPVLRAAMAQAAPLAWAKQWPGPGGLSDGLQLPGAWLAYPLPAGEWIGYALAALAIARGESWEWDGEGGAWVAGRRLMRREGYQRAFTNADTAARWRAQYTAELAGVLAGRLCSPGDSLTVWQDHGRERDRAAARRLMVMSEKQMNPGKRAALMEDAAWLVARI